MTDRGSGPTAGARVLLEPGMWDELRLSWRLLRDPRVAPRAKFVVPGLAVLYFLSPIDIIPDFFLGLGQLDDLGIITLAILFLIRLVPKMAPPEIVQQHMAEMGLAPEPTHADSTRPADERVVDAQFRVRQ